MTERRTRGEGSDDAAPRRSDEVDTSILTLSPAERRERNISDDTVRAAFFQAVTEGDREEKSLAGATLPGLSLSYSVVGGSDNHPIDLRGATINGHLDIDHADIQVPVLLDDAQVTALRFDDTEFTSLHGEGLVVDDEVSMTDAFFRGEVDLRDAEFGGAVDADEAVFDDEVAADGAAFEGQFTARGAEFHGDSNRLGDNTSFAEARFGAGVDCTQTEFGFVSFEDAAFEGPTTFHEAEFNGDAGFQRVWFANGATFDEARFREDAVFDGSVVDGPAMFRGALFEGGTRIIKDDASFERVTFAGRAAFHHASFRYGTFAESDFKAGAGFEHARFDGDAAFHDATFAGESTFDEVSFRADSDFRGTTFEAPTRFRGAEFLGDANHFRDSATFTDAVFGADVDFGDATFTSGDFTRTRFDGVADFGNVTVSERLDVAAATREGAVIDMSHISLPDGRIVQPEAGWVRYDLTKASLGEVELTSAGEDHQRELLDYFRFCDTEFTEFDGQNFDFAAHTASLERNNWKLHTFVGDAAPGVDLEMTPDVVERTYLKAKNCASLTGDTTAAGEFRVKRQQFSRKKNLEVARDGDAALTARIRNVVRAGENAFLEFTCGHGMRLLRITAVFLLLPVPPALLYAFGGPLFATDAGQISSLAQLTSPEGVAVLSDTLKFSYITYTTLAYGEIYPTGPLATTLATLEAYLSTVLAALVVYALVKRSEV